MSYNIGRLLYQLPQQLQLYYRKYESLYKKKINKMWALNFNKTCINENLWPTFTTISKRLIIILYKKCFYIR